MADVTELRCWPACVDAIDWSPEGIIALASDERVELLFPNTVTFDRDQDGAQWQHVPLQVPWFSNEELSTKEPAHLSNFSIGEEISASAPLAIAWSSPGLAKHRRCALAVLTANLVLSIWAADGRPQEESSWGRRLIINHVLANYFASQSMNNSDHAISNLKERTRLGSRIRTFAWAPPLPNAVPTKTLGSRLSYGQHIVATCNDDNQVALVIINSPTSTYGVQLGWSAKVVTNFSPTPASHCAFSDPRLFAHLIKQQRTVSRLAWSPWTILNGRNQSIIAYATNDDVRARVIILADGDLQYGDEAVYPDISMRYNGLMKWSPVVENGDRLTLALFTITGLVCLNISMNDASILETSSHDLDDRWDQTSGAFWDTAQFPLLHLHFSSLLSTINNPTSSLEKTQNGFAVDDIPSWRDQIENSAALFSVKNDLRGNSKVKVWGLAVSPLRDFVVTCTSVHPSDMIEYGAPNARRGTVAVSALRQFSRARGSFPSMDVSAEGVLFTVKKLVEYAVEEADDMLPFSEEMIEKLTQAYQPISTMGNDIATAASPSAKADLHTLVTNFKQFAHFNAYTLKDRFTILVSHACNITGSKDLARTMIAYRVAITSKDLLSYLPQTPFSADVLRHHKQLISLLSNITNSVTDSARHTESLTGDGQEQDLQRTDATDFPSQSELIDPFTLQVDMNTALTDTCEFCAAPIPFTDLGSAICSNGHIFPRCGLSMLAIQAPGITKYCGICSTPYLSEEFVKLQEVNSRDPSMEMEGRSGMRDVRATANGVHGHGLTAQEDVHGLRMVDVEGTSQNRSNEEGKTPESRQRTSDERQGGHLVTLARVLFLATDVCIYCGGHFV